MLFYASFWVLNIRRYSIKYHSTEAVWSLWTNENILLRATSKGFFKKRPFTASFSLFLSFQYSWQSNVQYKFLPMTGFEPRTSGFGTDRSTNWGTTTAQHQKLFDYLGIALKGFRVSFHSMWCACRKVAVWPDDQFLKKIFGRLHQLKYCAKGGTNLCQYQNRLIKYYKRFLNISQSCKISQKLVTLVGR